MKLKNFFSILALSFSAMLPLSSCEKDVPDSPWNFQIEGTWQCYRNLEDQGTVIFDSDGRGVCVAPYSTPETGAPFTYTYTRNKKELDGKLVITSTADPADYPDLNPECISFRPGEYWLSPTTTERFLILSGDEKNHNKIQWNLTAHNDNNDSE